MARHSPQRIGIETRADKKGRESHRGVVYDKRSGKKITARGRTRSPRRAGGVTTR
jgi:hypothetical protein